MKVAVTSYRTGKLAMDVSVVLSLHGIVLLLQTNVRTSEGWRVHDAARVRWAHGHDGRAYGHDGAPLCV